ncbi:type IV toxin-antitoxin system AbiEi family antitoxin domain-containing protein [Bradyrhizobium sp. JR3.5]
MKEKGLVVQLGRGLYQLPDAPIDTHHSLAEAAKRVPKGVVALTSALAFHDLTDSIPSMVWLAIGPKDRQPLPNQSSHAVRSFQPGAASGGRGDPYDRRLPGEESSARPRPSSIFFATSGAPGHAIVTAPGLNLALEGLREALRTRKAKPSEIAGFARKAGVWKVMQPYMEAMTANG